HHSTNKQKAARRAAYLPHFPSPLVGEGAPKGRMRGQRRLGSGGCGSNPSPCSSAERRRTVPLPQGEREKKLANQFVVVEEELDFFGSGFRRIRTMHRVFA